eukprot:1149920-Pelagomonas_calceolata.AAC.10
MEAAGTKLSEDQHQTPRPLTRAVETVMRRCAAGVPQSDGPRVRAPRRECAWHLADRCFVHLELRPVQIPVPRKAVGRNKLKVGHVGPRDMWVQGTRGSKP